jgi:23S rRNA pseudouridine1911/1915/1917 synthase
LVIAKKESAMTHLARQFFDHSIQRTYQALVWGCPDAQGTIRASIDRDPADRQRMKGYADHRTGKPAVTHYRRLENWGPVSLMEFTLETGRTHQIRVHTSMHGFPIFNDATYGGDVLVRGPQRGSYRSFVAQCMRDMPRMALHAKTLGFVHPDTGQNLFFDSELPVDFEGVLKAWKTWALQEI